MKIAKRTKTGWTAYQLNKNKMFCDDCKSRLYIAPDGKTKYCDTAIRDGLKYSKLLPKSKKVVMGVTATKLIFEKFNLPRYKEVNYLWEIK